MNEFGEYDVGDRVIYRPGIMDIPGTIETTDDLNYRNGAGTLRDYTIKLDWSIAGNDSKLEINREFAAFFSPSLPAP